MAVEAGDYVWASDPETGEVALKRVVQTFINESNELVHVEVGGEEIVCTNEHPFYSPVKGWMAACELRAGDVPVTVAGEYIVVEKIQHEILESPVKVYNFEVEDFHTYFITELNVLVHNDCSEQFRFDPNQQAVLDLAKEYKNGISFSEAQILVGWAVEYGISTHYPTLHPGRSGIWSMTLHIKIKNYHIPVID